MVEEAVRADESKITDDTKVRAVRSDGEEYEQPEEGEIVGGDDGDGDTLSSSSSRPGTAIVQHPLEHSWTFWCDTASTKAKQVEWGSSMRPIHTFSTVEDFWRIYNNIHRPSKLATGTDLYCFKNKIEPKWEDPVCAAGGNWTMTFTKFKSDTCWLHTLLAMIGEQFDHGDDICGAVINARPKNERISLWTRNAANASAQISIGKQWKKILDQNDTIGFIVHQDALTLGKAAKNKHTV